MLNCKPGQRVIAIAGPVNMGRIAVTESLIEMGQPIVSRCGKYTAVFLNAYVMTIEFEGKTTFSRYRNSHHWLLDNFFSWTAFVGEGDNTETHTVFFPFMPDATLKPLLDVEGEDEMITIAGKPVHEKELETC